MNRFRVLSLAVAICLVTASLGWAAGPQGGPQGPKVTGQAKGPKITGQAKGPKVAAGAKAPKTGKPADAGARARADRDNRNDSARGNRDDRTIATDISRNPNLRDRLQAMLPANMTLEQASSGFRNQGQFIAALEASKNQNIPFVDLKREMTGANALSLGQAVQKLRPERPTSGQGQNR